MLFKVVNILLPLVSFIVVAMALKRLHSYAGRVPDMWKKMLTGMGFIVFSEMFGFFKIYYEQASYHIDFFTQVYLIVGLTYFFVGLMPYLREIIGD